MSGEKTKTEGARRGEAENETENEKTDVRENAARVKVLAKDEEAKNRSKTSWGCFQPLETALGEE